MGERVHNWKGGPHQRKCLNCGNTFVAKLTRVRYCSRKCWFGSKECREARAKRNRGLLKPTKLEQNLEALLEKVFPDEWEYTGDGKVILDGMIPDFFNRNGKKMVIEAYGTYWHKEKARTWRRTELGRIMAYKALGVECLVIWEEELKNESELVTKIRRFCEK